MYDDAYCEVGEYDKVVSSFLTLLDDARILGSFDEICHMVDEKGRYRNGLIKVAIEKHHFVKVS